jgi:hypothetical protein
MKPKRRKPIVTRKRGRVRLKAAHSTRRKSN